MVSTVLLYIDCFIAIIEPSCDLSEYCKQPYVRRICNKLSDIDYLTYNIESYKDESAIVKNFKGENLYSSKADFDISYPKTLN